ncbi:asparagine synthetase A [Jatrophihabitans sp.]|jgi:asparaginyl-tRNA synthetase|uniref:asparagine synthetase A n=1 Tax=Jatrophihabitans sp. TaxID=1932789 RepID=UPI002EDCCD7F
MILSTRGPSREGAVDAADLLPPDPREHLTSERTRAALRLQGVALTAAREHLAAAGFIELLPPIIGPVTDPGARGAKQVDIDYYGQRYKLMTSAILYKQASLLAFDRIFCIAPNVRLEPIETATTGRHLTEFHQIDVEMAGAGREQIMTVAEELLRHVVTAVASRAGDELQLLGRDVEVLTAGVLAPFAHRPHAEVTAELTARGELCNPDAEIDWLSERLLSERSSAPFFVTDYPKGSRGFYDREDAARPGVLRNFDLLLPEGYGELCSGSEREHEYARVVARMRETGENPAKYGWYLKLVREGIPASAGFGMGLERLVRYLAGLESVWQAHAFPKVAGVVSP